MTTWPGCLGSVVAHILAELSRLGRVKEGLSQPLQKHVSDDLKTSGLHPFEVSLLPVSAKRGIKSLKCGSLGGDSGSK